MTRLILQPASNPEARKHYEDTIESRVPLDLLERHVTPEILQRLTSIYGKEGAYVWGAIPGKHNSRYYGEMQPGDTVLFYRDGEFFESFVLALKIPDNPGNEALAKELWRTKTNERTGEEETWEHVFFLRGRKPLVPPIDYTVMRSVIEFGPSDRLWGLTVLDESLSRRALDAFALRRDGSTSARTELELDNAEQEELAGQAQVKAEWKRGQGFQGNAKSRKAIDKHAMLAAEQYFKNAGYNVEDVSQTRSYDLHCSMGGEEVLVEVKGTSTEGSSVFLTGNEVQLARERKNDIALYILHSVRVSERDGEIRTSGGKEIVYWPWDIDEGTISLVTVSYEPGDPASSLKNPS